jgi:hypothetical protein
MGSARGNAARRRRRKGRPAVTVVQEGQELFVESECGEVLSLLETMKHTVRVDRKHGTRLVPASEPLWQQFDDHCTPHLPAGLAPALFALLGHAGYTVKNDRMTDTLPTPLAEPDFGRAPDRPLLEFIQSHERGMILLDRSMVDPVGLIARIAQSFPTATFAVMGTRAEEVKQFAMGLRLHIRDVVWLTGKGCPTHPARVVISTPMGLGDNQVLLPERDIFVALDAVEAIGEPAQRALQYAQRARLFGLLDHARRPAPRDRDRIAAWFGFDSIFVPRLGFVDRPVAVAFARIDGGPRPVQNLEGTALKREGLWTHPVRNRRLARLAKVLARKSYPEIQEHFPAVAGLLEDVPTFPTVVVLVESLDHALLLADLLPDWSILAGPSVTTAGLPARQVETLKRRRGDGAGPPSLAIATLTGIGAIDLGGLDVLIRADGGDGIPSALASIPIEGDKVANPLLLVDCDDRHRPELRRRSRRRREAYGERGWTVDGVPAPSPLERFLDALRRRHR